VQVPVLTVTDVKAGRELLAAQVRAGETFVLSYRHSVTREPVSGTFEVEADGSLVPKETAFPSPGPGLPEPRPGDDYEISGGVIRQRSRGQRLPEISVFVQPFTEHTLVLRGQALNLSGSVVSSGLMRIRVERRHWWWKGGQRIGALLSRAR
jgi:hypothetical protein